MNEAIVMDRPEDQKQERYVNATEVLPPELLALVQRYVTGLLWIPVPKKHAVRDLRIVELRKKGVHPEDLAVQFGISTRRVWQILRRDEPALSQKYREQQQRLEEMESCEDMHLLDFYEVQDEQ